MGRRQEAGERAPTRQKISVFDKREQRKLACYAERTTDAKPSAEKACILSLLVLCLARRKKTSSRRMDLYKQDK